MLVRCLQRTPSELSKAEADWSTFSSAWAPDVQPPVYDLVAHLKRQRVFSIRAFGPHYRLQNILKHIAKELEELDAHRTDLMEWIDVALLAFDGAWRAGFTPEEIAAALRDKLIVNEHREWPDWRKVDVDQVIEHKED